MATIPLNPLMWWVNRLLYCFVGAPAAFCWDHLLASTDRCGPTVWCWWFWWFPWLLISGQGCDHAEIANIKKHFFLRIIPGSTLQSDFSPPVRIVIRLSPNPSSLAKNKANEPKKTQKTMTPWDDEIGPDEQDVIVRNVIWLNNPAGLSC